MTSSRGLLKRILAVEAMLIALVAVADVINMAAGEDHFVRLVIPSRLGEVVQQLGTFVLAAAALWMVTGPGGALLLLRRVPACLVTLNH